MSTEILGEFKIYQEGNFCMDSTTSVNIFASVMLEVISYKVKKVTQTDAIINFINFGLSCVFFIYSDGPVDWQMSFFLQNISVKVFSK